MSQNVATQEKKIAKGEKRDDGREMSDEPRIPTADEKMMARANALVHAVVESGNLNATVTATNGEQRFRVSIQTQERHDAQIEELIRMRKALEHLAFIGEKCDVKATANRALGR